MEVQKYLKGSRKLFHRSNNFFFYGWEVFGRLRINFVYRELFCRSRIFLSIENFFVDREISCRSRNYFVDREISCRAWIFLTVDNFFGNRQIGKRVPISVRRRSSPARQVETEDVSLSELIGYQIYPHKWNFCTVSISRGWSPKPCGAFSIFLLVAL